jgi:hypothetical protein
MITLHRSPVSGACVSALFLLTLAATVRPASTAELIPPKNAERLFPQGVFCPFPFDVPFTTDGKDITIRISTSTVNYFDTNIGEQVWTHQMIDNICVVSEADYADHHGPLGTYSEDCYFIDFDHRFPVTETFYFHQAGATPLKELFPADGADPALTGWDLSHGCEWNTTDTGPNDPGTDSDFATKGCLNLGLQSQTAPDDSAYTTRVITGLSPKTNYRLTGWWDVNQMQLGQVDLTVRIFGSVNPTPIVIRTWGALKREYR